MKHDFGKIYMGKDGSNPQFRISYARDPLSFLLTICDTIQGFSRPNVMCSLGSGNTCRPEFTEKCSKVTLEWNDSNAVLTLKYHYPQNSDRIANATKHLPKEECEIFDPGKDFLIFQLRVSRSAIR